MVGKHDLSPEKQASVQASAYSKTSMFSQF